MTSPKRAFAEHLDALRARLARERRAAGPGERQELQDRHDAMVRWASEPPPPGVVGVRTIPRQWEWGLLEVEFGPEPAPGHDEDIDGVQHRDPIPVPQLVEAVQLRLAEDMAWEQIEERVGLSHRKVNYIRQAIKAGDLSWAPNRAVPVFGPDTRNSAGGVTLPKR